MTREQFASPLARRPYDLRHAAVSLWLNAGVPATEVARRAGHGVAVMLSVYANCIDGQEHVANDRIEEVLATAGARRCAPESDFASQGRASEPAEDPG